MGQDGTEWVQLTTSDGHVLDGDLARAADPHAADPHAADPHGADPHGAVVLCHPHPQYGGSRFDRVIDALTRELPAAGFDALRFDFRRAYGGGIDERLDALAALDLLAERRPGTPLHLIGYSFGAMVALGVHDDRLASHVLIAPPLVGGYAAFEPPSGPMLLLVPEHDQFCGPETVAEVTAGWPGAAEGSRTTRVETITMADHFFAGRVDAVVSATVDWLRPR